MLKPSRILQILSSEIYDSPKAFLRENLQNAYDAVLMRSTAKGTPLSERHIDVRVDGQVLIVRDDGIGMIEDVLKNNFWRSGFQRQEFRVGPTRRRHRYLRHRRHGQFWSLPVAEGRDVSHRLGHDSDQFRAS